MSVTAPDLESARKAWAAAEEEDAFWDEHYDAFLERYPDQLVAVTKADGQFVTADPDLDRLVAMVEENGLGVRSVWVRFLAATPIHLAL